jgi:hypothetical protein
MGNLGSSMSNMSMNQRSAMTTPNVFSLPPPPGQRPTMSSPNSFSLPPPPASNAFSLPSYQVPQQSSMASTFGNPPQAKPPAQKSGLDAYQSLLWWYNVANGVRRPWDLRHSSLWNFWMRPWRTSVEFQGIWKCCD